MQITNHSLTESQKSLAAQARVKAAALAILEKTPDPGEASKELLRWAESSPQNWHDLTVDVGPRCAREQIRLLSPRPPFDHDRQRAIMAPIGQERRDNKFDWSLPKTKGKGPKRPK
jgi:hypothetical protein